MYGDTVEMQCEYLVNACKCGRWTCNALPGRVKIKDTSVCDDPLNFGDVGEACSRYLERKEEESERNG